MREIVKLKLSELNDEVEICREESTCVYTVAELKKEIEGGEPWHEETDWYTVNRAIWLPDAKRMFEDYIENEGNNMNFEDFDDHAARHYDSSHIERMQAILNEAFGTGIKYWEYDKPVEIDIFPPDGGKAED